MDYYGALPSYFKGLEKCPVGGLKNVTEDDDFFFNSQCEGKMHSLSVYQSPQCF